MKQTKIVGLTMILLFGALVLRGQGWVKTYPYEIGRNIQTDATNLAEAPNGDFIAGAVLSDGLSLMRTNKDGAFIWQRKYTFPFTPNSLDVVCLQDGSIFMYSNGPFAAPQYNNFLLKVNARGDSLSLKKNANWYQNARLIPISDNSSTCRESR